MSVRMGIEHEFVVKKGGAPVDFRSIVHGLPLDGVCLDPTDPNAYRLMSGAMITCDGAEAEIATPPLDVKPGFVERARRWTSSAARSLCDALGPDHTLTGVSTHISVSVPEPIGPDAAGLFARTFAPALMLMMDGPDSPGLLVRPRYGRIELGGEYAAGETLGAALAMAVGGVLVCRDVAMGTTARSRLPPPLGMTIEPAVLRYGWYVDRSAFGVDLYSASRHARIRRERIGRITVDKLLRTAWRTARSALADHAAPEDRAAAEAFAKGTSPLPTERPVDTRPDLDRPPPQRHPLGRILERVDRGEFVVTPIVTSWDFTVLRVAGAREIYLTVPAADTAEFVVHLSSGVFDRALAERLRRPSDGTVLRSHAGAERRAVYDDLGDVRGLGVPERGPRGHLGASPHVRHPG